MLQRYELKVKYEKLRVKKMLPQRITKTENVVNVLHGTDEPHTMEQLKRQLLELQKECQKLSSEMVLLNKKNKKTKKILPAPLFKKKKK